MENFKGTKGEWVYNEKYQTIEDKDGFGIAQQNGIKNSSKWEYDAKLIAAAPDMLLALQEIVKWSAHFSNAMDNDLQKAINAINKATK